MAFVYSRGNILFRGANGEQYSIKKDAVAMVPEWVEKTPYYAALIKDGKLVAAEAKKDSVVADEIVKGEAKEKAKTEKLIEENTAEEKPKKRSSKK